MKSISIIIPCYNEEKNIEKAVNKYENIVKELFDDYELIIVDDGSKDKTFIKSMELIRNNNKIIYSAHKNNQGIGAAFRTGLEIASKEYVLMLSGEGDPSEEGIKEIMSLAGTADIIKTYILNNNERAWYRRLASKTMTVILNKRFGLKMRYYSGYVLYKRKDLEGITMNINDSTFTAQIIISLIKKGKSYKEIGYLSDGVGSKSNIFKIKNIIRAIKSLKKIMI